MEKEKWDEKSKECRFLGYLEDTKGYRLIDRNEKNIISRDVTFFESEKPKENEKCEEKVNAANTIEFEIIPKNTAENFIEENNIEDLWNSRKYNNINISSESDTPVEDLEDNQVWRSNRQAKPKIIEDFLTFMTCNWDSITMEEAMEKMIKMSGSKK